MADQMTDRERELYQRAFNDAHAIYQEEIAKLTTAQGKLTAAMKRTLERLGTIETVQVSGKAGELSYSWCNRVVGAQCDLLSALKKLEES